MNHEEYRKILAIHGYQSSDEDSDSSSKVEFDDVYEKYKPSPIDIDPSRDKIIDIEACEETHLKPNVSYSSALLNKHDEESYVYSSDLNMQSESPINESTSQKKRLSKRQRKNLKKAMKAGKVLEVKSPNKETVNHKSIETISTKNKVIDNNLEQNSDTVDDKVSEISIKNTEFMKNKQEMSLDNKTVENKSGEKSEVMNGRPIQRNHLTFSALLAESIRINESWTQVDGMLLDLHNILPNICCNPILIYNRLGYFLPKLKSMGIPILRCCECTYSIISDLYKAFHMFLNVGFSPNNLHNFFYLCDDIIVKNVHVWGFIPSHCLNTLDLKIHQGLLLILQELMRNIYKYYKEKMLNHCSKQRQIENILISKYIFGNLNDFHLGMLANEIIANRRREELLGTPIVVLQNLRESTQTRLPACVVQILTDTPSVDGQTSLHSDVVEVLTETEQNVVLEPLVLEDQTENKKYFYDCYLDEDNFDHWIEFQNDYLNKSLLAPEESCNIDFPLIFLQEAAGFYNIVMGVAVACLFKRIVFDTLHHLLDFVDVGIDFVIFMILLFYFCLLFVCRF